MVLKLFVTAFMYFSKTIWIKLFLDFVLQNGWYDRNSKFQKFSESNKDEKYSPQINQLTTNFRVLHPRYCHWCILEQKWLFSNRFPNSVFFLSCRPTCLQGSLLPARIPIFFWSYKFAFISPISPIKTFILKIFIPKFVFSARMSFSLARAFRFFGIFTPKPCHFLIISINWFSICDFWRLIFPFVRGVELE